MTVCVGRIQRLLTAWGRVPLAPSAATALHARVEGTVALHEPLVVLGFLIQNVLLLYESMYVDHHACKPFRGHTCHGDQPLAVLLLA